MVLDFPEVLHLVPEVLQLVQERAVAALLMLRTEWLVALLFRSVEVYSSHFVAEVGQLVVDLFLLLIARLLVLSVAHPLVLLVVLIVPEESAFRFVEKFSHLVSPLQSLQFPHLALVPALSALEMAASAMPIRAARTRPR